MLIQDLIDLISGMDGVLALKPQPGDGTPEIAWGDVFFYYAPDGVVPKTQPFATIITKDYPDDDARRLDRPDAYRLNISAGTAAETEPKDDTVIAHPVYGRQGWVAIVNPGPNTEGTAKQFLDEAYQRARQRFERRTTPGTDS